MIRRLLIAIGLATGTVTLAALPAAAGVDHVPQFTRVSCAAVNDAVGSPIPSAGVSAVLDELDAAGKVIKLDARCFVRLSPFQQRVLASLRASDQAKHDAYRAAIVECAKANSAGYRWFCG